MMPSHLFHLVYQVFYTPILLVSLSLKFRINIAVISIFPQIFHRCLIVDALVFIMTGLPGDLSHIVEFSVNAYNMRDNINDILRLCTGLMCSHPLYITSRNPVSRKLLVH